MVYRGQLGRFVGSGSSQPTTSSTEAWLVQEPMSGGLEDGTVIPSFGGHVARYIWIEHERSVLCCLSRSKLCSDLVMWRGRQSVENLEVIHGSWLSHLPGLMFKRLNWPLISAFVERWQPDTNTFHMPFGEIMILLHDVYNILWLRVEGNMVTTTLSTNVLREACSITMDMTPDDLSEICGTKTIWQGSGVLSDKIFESTLEVEREFSDQLTGYLWLVLGGTLFVDKTGNRTHPSFLHELCYMDVPINEYAWGTAALAYFYRQLGTASRNGANSIAGCLTLLQARIYEVVRQLGFVQGIPHEIIRPEKAKRRTNLKMYRVDFPTEMTDVMWKRLSAAAPSVAPGYMQWLYRISHLRVSPGAGVTSNLHEQTNTDYWMDRSMEIHHRALAEYPHMSSETRTMTEQLVFDWK
ncbi:protein MAIN-LIKE 2-like [Chenopodium quinoa]|uniref:protein MAIN-LIKE 2-like n=1 Tax=Chenopodium quinoa TaxID=63459 RepID=UPI000B78FC3D|nr:protein MAIN-LIKE 2-like [Chenopodium quinoa]